MKIRLLKHEFLYERMYKNKKITRKIMTAVTQYKTYVIYNVASTPNIAYFDFTLNYTVGITAKKSKAGDFLV